MIYNTYAYTLLHALADDQYVGLLTAAPTDIFTVDNEVEYPPNYARDQVLAADWDNVALANKIANGEQLTFGTKSTAGSVLLTHFGIYTASSGGTWRHASALASNVTINQNDTPVFAVGQLVLKAE